MRKLFVITLFNLIVFGLAAQKIEVNGKLDFLKDQKEIKVSYDYSNMAIGKFDKEEDYIAQKTADYEKKEPGSGEKWKTAWVADRSARFEPKFETLFNENSKFPCSQSPTEAKYEMKIHTIFTEPGFNIGITRKPAMLNVEIKFVDLASGREEAVMMVKNCPGRDAVGFDFDTGYRIEEGYAKLGKSVGSYLAKNLK
jgi:hypothetical protein